MDLHSIVIRTCKKNKLILRSRSYMPSRKGV